MSSIPYLLTGVTGGLGAKVLDDMLRKHNIAPSFIIVTGRSSSSREKFEAQGLTFRELDYQRPETIASALGTSGVDNLFFVSSSSFDDNLRRVEHQNIVNAAKAAGVKTTWYVSLACGGFGVNDEVAFQKAHNETEVMMIKSGINFISLRAAVYAEAFPLHITWYPSAESIDLPLLSPPLSQGQIAMASRDELGEGMATLLAQGLPAFPSIKPKTERRIILLTANKTVTLDDIAVAINQNRTEQQPINHLKPEDWVDSVVKKDADEGGKPKAWFEASLIWLQEFAKGAASATDPALGTLLGREPLDGTQLVAKVLHADQNFGWHQTNARSKGFDKK